MFNLLQFGLCLFHLTVTSIFSYPMDIFQFLVEFDIVNHTFLLETVCSAGFHEYYYLLTFYLALWLLFLPIIKNIYIIFFCTFILLYLLIKWWNFSRLKSGLSSHSIISPQAPIYITKYMYVTLKTLNLAHNSLLRLSTYVSYFISPRECFSLNVSDTKLPPKFFLSNVSNFIG